MQLSQCTQDLLMFSLACKLEVARRYIEKKKTKAFYVAATADVIKKQKNNRFIPLQQNTVAKQVYDSDARRLIWMIHLD